MAIQSSLYSGTALDSRTFPSTKHIATKAHMGIHRYIILSDTWERVNISEYQLINNSCVLNQLLNTSLYNQLEVRVADTPDELGASISDIATVASIANKVVTTAGIDTEIVTIAGIDTKIQSLYADKAILDSLFADKVTLDSLFTDKDTLDSLYADKAILDSIFADKVTLDSIFADKTQLDAIYADLANILAASGYATTAQLKAWEAEAERLTADSYATEVEDIPINIVTSDGDGTFTYTPTDPIEYSALHWAVKAEENAATTAIAVSISDNGDYFISDNVEGALQEVGEILSIFLILENISELIGYDVTYGTIYAKGYYAPNDGGGGIFSYDSTIDKSTANGGTIIDPSVSLALQGTGIGIGCWIRQYSGAINIKWFGAKGDGSTDDTSIIQATINYCLSNRKELYMPSGVYIITSLSINAGNKSLKIFGTSSMRGDEFDAGTGHEYGTILYASTISGSTTAISISSASTQHRIILENISIQGVNDQSATAVDTTTGLNIQNAPSTILQNVTIDRFKNGLVFANGWHSKFYNLEITSCYIGITLGDGMNVVAIYSCRTTKCYIGVYVTNGGGLSLHNHWFEDCSYGFNLHNPTDTNAYEGLVLINPWFEDIAQDAITIGYQIGSSTLSTLDIRDITLIDGHFDSITGDKFKFSSAVSRNIVVQGMMSSSNKSFFIGDLSKIRFLTSDGLRTSQTSLGSQITELIYEKDNFVEGATVNVPILRVTVPNKEMGGYVKVKYFVNTNVSQYYLAGEFTLLIGRKTNNDLYYKLAETTFDVAGTPSLTNIKADDGLGGVYYNVDWAISNITGASTATQTVDILINADNNQSETAYAKLDIEVFSGHRKQSESYSRLSIVGL